MLFKSEWNGYFGHKKNFQPQSWIEPTINKSDIIGPVMVWIGSKVVRKTKQIPYFLLTMLNQLEPIVLRQMYPPQKKDENLRSCLGSHRRKAVIVLDSYQIPSMNECIGFMGGSQLFSRFEAHSNCWQIEVDNNDRETLISTFQYGLHQLPKIQFGLKHDQASNPSHTSCYPALNGISS